MSTEPEAGTIMQSVTIGDTKIVNPIIWSSRSLPDTGPVHGTDEFRIIHTATPKGKKKTISIDNDEPLVDTTAALAKNSKKTRRLGKQQLKRERKAAMRSRPQSFLDLPAELLHEILSHLRPSDIWRLQSVNQDTRRYIQHHERSIAQEIMDRRYWVLQQCFPLPALMEHVDEQTQKALLNPRRQNMTEIHKKPYHHIKPLDPHVVCSCPSCLLAWNSLNVVLDFAHFQSYLNAREPIPMIQRGTNPQWNQDLTSQHAAVVLRAITSPLTYAAILETHVESIIGTLLRQVRFPPHVPKHRHNSKNTPLIAKTAHPNRLYHVTEKDANGTDEFLERDGRETFDLPFHRDNYYSLSAYVPNRRRDRENHRWMYYARGGHERDLEWLRRWFMPKGIDEAGQESFATTSRAAMTM
jgi:hypothetical protein